MKKQFLITLAIFVSTISSAQIASKFGVKAGFISSGIRGESSNNLDNLLSFSNGVITTKNRSGFFAGGYAAIPEASLRKNWKPMSSRVLFCDEWEQHSPGRRQP